MISRLSALVSASSRHIAALSAAVMIAPAVLSASEHGHTPQFSDLTWYYINFGTFLLLAFIAHRAAGRPLPAAWERRWKSIEKEIADGAAELRKAEVGFNEVNARLGDIDGRILELRRQIESEALHESEEVIGNGRKKADSISAQVRMTAGQERAAAEQQLHNELAEEVVLKAVSLLKERTTTESDRGRREDAVRGARELTA